MNTLSRALAWLLEPNEVAEQRRSEAYLSEAKDLNDLEWRQRQLDQRRPFGPFGYSS